MRDKVINLDNNKLYENKLISNNSAKSDLLINTEVEINEIKHSSPLTKKIKLRNQSMKDCSLKNSLTKMKNKLNLQLENEIDNNIYSKINLEKQDTN